MDNWEDRQSRNIREWKCDGEERGNGGQKWRNRKMVLDYGALVSINNWGFHKWEIE